MQATQAAQAKPATREKVLIDGAMGEGGGQVLRSALTLAMLKQVSVEIVNIRAKRNKPGLLRQHLTCVKAAQQVCGATVEGDQLGSQRVLFTPGKVQAGNYHFAVGSAGSTALVCQTVLPVLAVAKGESKLSFEGGTHAKAAPSLSFLQNAYFPVLRLMGVGIDLAIERLGFYPAGGGRWSLKLTPAKALRSFHLSENQVKPLNLAKHLSITALVSLLPRSIAEREVSKAKALLSLPEHPATVTDVASPGPGNILMLQVDQGGYCNQFDITGEPGISAESVAKRAVGRLNKLLQSGAAVEEQLADQLLLPMVLAGGGSFTTTKPSLHTTTNVEVIRAFGGVAVEVTAAGKQRWRVNVVSA